MLRKIKKKYVVYLLIISIILSFLFASQIKIVLRNNIPADIYQRISFIKKLVLNQDYGFYKYERIIADRYSEIKNFIYNENIIFELNKDHKLINNKRFDIYKVPPIFPAIGGHEVNTAYIDKYQENLIYATKNGIFFKINLLDSRYKMIPIKSNLSNFFVTTQREKNASINYFNSNTISKFGVKDIFIDSQNIYLSYIEEFNQDGYNVSVLKAKFSDSLIFKSLFSSKNYISSSYKEFYPIQSGGRIVNFRKDSILLSIGEFRDRLKAQDIDSDNGKIISINKYNGGRRIISMGHRNPQGLDYDPINDNIVSTEHGPYGGDEINFNRDLNIVNNFGWPISNYGYHYGEQNVINDSHYADNARIVKGAPLYKSHSDHGFVEPIKYWMINPAVSEVKFINHTNDYSEFFVSTLGYDTINRPLAQHLIRYQYNLKNKSLNLIEKYNVGERVRDLIFDKDLNSIIYTGESSGVIGILPLQQD
jgi:glucose/arabinose dehydrogenase